MGRHKKTLKPTKSFQKILYYLSTVNKADAYWRTTSKCFRFKSYFDILHDMDFSVQHCWLSTFRSPLLAKNFACGWPQFIIFTSHLLIFPLLYPLRATPVSYLVYNSSETISFTLLPFSYFFSCCYNFWLSMRKMRHIWGTLYNAS